MSLAAREREQQSKKKRGAAVRLVRELLPGDLHGARAVLSREMAE